MVVFFCEVDEDGVGIWYDGFVVVDVAVVYFLFCFFFFLNVNGFDFKCFIVFVGWSYGQRSG
ncbi:hypothetical protein DF186_24520, partial [Enterococcus hirae]